MSPEEIEKIKNKSSRIEMTKRIMEEIEVADKKHRNEVVFDLIACLLMFAILIALMRGGSVLWATLVTSSFYAGYLTARKKG